MKKLINILGIVALISLFLSVPISTVMADESAAESSISNARNQLVSCYDAAKEAEAAGANITTLALSLNEAGSLLSSAQFAFSKGDFAIAQDYAVQSQSKLVDFMSKASALLATAAPEQNQYFPINLVGSIGGTFAILAGSIGLWLYLKKREAHMSGGEPIELE